MHKITVFIDIRAVSDHSTEPACKAPLSTLLYGCIVWCWMIDKLSIALESEFGKWPLVWEQAGHRLSSNFLPDKVKRWFISFFLDFIKTISTVCVLDHRSVVY